jgi:hypothetical protein
VEVLDAVGAVLLAACLYLLALFVRQRMLLRAAGTIEMAMHRRHWTFGLGRYDGQRLLWFRTFSLSLRPARQFPRAELRVVGRREPRGHELVTLLHDAVILDCRSGGERVEIALHDSAAMGLSSWLEASPLRSRH